MPRSYFRNRTRLLLWSAICFVMLAVDNPLAVLDLFVLTAIDLTLYRYLATFIGLGFLLYGFIWEDA